MNRIAAAAALGLALSLASVVSPAYSADDTGTCYGCEELSTSVDAGNGQYDINQMSHENGKSGPARGASSGSRTNKCPGCTYQYVLACPSNHIGGQFDAGCVGAAAGCPTGQLRYRVYVTRPPAPFATQQGTVCRGGTAAPITAADLVANVLNYLDHLIPPAPGLRVQPTEMALVNYPVLFDARGLTPVTATFAALGVPVTVHATPVRYEWSIDGVANAMHTTSPGRPYDGHGATLGDGYYVSWVFDHHGVHTVAVTVRWSASFDAAGQAGVPVTGGVSRTSAPVSFTVHEAPGQLVAD